MATRIVPTALHPRKMPRQSRARATVDAIVEAAARILAIESHDGFSTNHVAELAGVSIGSLYQYFPNKAALIAAVLDREHHALADAVESLVEALEGASLTVSLAAMALFAVAQQFDQPRLAAVLDLEERRLPIDAMLAGAEARILAGVERLLERHRHALPYDLSAHAAHDCLSIAKALVESEIGSGQIEAAHGAPPDLEARVLRALTGYLTVTSIRNERAAPGATVKMPGLSAKAPV